MLERENQPQIEKNETIIQESNGTEEQFMEKYGNRKSRECLESKDIEKVKEHFRGIDLFVQKFDQDPKLKNILNRESFPNTTFPLRSLFENARKASMGEKIGFPKGEFDGTIASLSRQVPSFEIIEDQGEEIYVIHFKAIDPMDHSKSSATDLTDFSRIELKQKEDHAEITCICYGRDYVYNDYVYHFVIKGDQTSVEIKNYMQEIKENDTDQLSPEEWDKLTSIDDIEEDEDYGKDE